MCDLCAFKLLCSFTKESNSLLDSGLSSNVVIDFEDDVPWVVDVVLARNEKMSDVIVFKIGVLDR